MADKDGDRHMDSSPDADELDAIETPANQITNPVDLLSTPPDSQHRSQANTAQQMSTTSAPGATGANANGKRPLHTISNGDEASEMAELSVSQAEPMISGANMSKARGHEFAPKTHKTSGYSWSKVEDEPGYAWMNKKADEERRRAWDGLVHRESMTKGRYQDILEVVDNEQTVAASLNMAATKQ